MESTNKIIPMRYDYENYIMEILRMTHDLESDDESLDNELTLLTPNEVFDTVLQWEGFLGYTYKIKAWIKSIYQVEL